MRGITLQDPVLVYKYINLLGEHLEGFVEKRPNEWNFRCPICGDSHFSKTKQRGYILQNKDLQYYFYCHNCNENMNFDYFLKTVDSNLYQQYRAEIRANFLKKKKEPETIKVQSAKQMVAFDEEIPKGMIPCNKLSEGHKAVEYLLGRGLPKSKLYRVWWTETFSDIIKDTIGGKYLEKKLPSEGIIFPLRDLETKKVTGFQIRSIEKNCPKARRFVICDHNDNHGYFFDKDMDFSKRIYVVEGCMDSLFLSNSIACLSASLWTVRPSENCVYINDCEPRNTNVAKAVKKCVDLGYQVALLPPSLYETLDINDIALKENKFGVELENLIDKHVYSGLSARFQFASKWKK